MSYCDVFINEIWAKMSTNCWKILQPDWGNSCLSSFGCCVLSSRWGWSLVTHHFDLYLFIYLLFAKGLIISLAPWLRGCCHLQHPQPNFKCLFFFCKRDQIFSPKKEIFCLDTVFWMRVTKKKKNVNHVRLRFFFLATICLWSEVNNHFLTLATASWWWSAPVWANARALLIYLGIISAATWRCVCN